MMGDGARVPMTHVSPIIDAYRAYPRGAPDDGAVTIMRWRLTAIVGEDEEENRANGEEIEVDDEIDDNRIVSTELRLQIAMVDCTYL